MGGLFAALLLRKAGWTVDVFERVDVELSGRGAGNRHSCRALRRPRSGWS